jgi:ribose/xylose/arabinose/galactoside ABC-type transport system permease subunit
MVVSQQQPVFDPPKPFAWLGGPQAWWVPVVIACVLGAFFVLMLAYTQFGRNLYAVGGNAEGARLSGIAVGRVRIKAFALSGTMAGFAGIILAMRTGVSSPNAAELFELDVIAACVIGGASLAGGVGGALAVLAGALVVSVLCSICGIKGVSSDGQKLMLGALLVSLVCYDSWRRRSAGILKD